MTHELPDARQLQWPAGWPRTLASQRRRARFGTNFGAAVRGLEAELRLLGATSVVVSTGLPPRIDGWPRSGSEPDDPGVAVYWTIPCIGGDAQQRVIACDTWDRVRDNLHAVELSVAAIRGLSRWGATEIVRRAFTGFAALPAARGDEWWREVLDVWADSTLERCESNYTALAKLLHPDVPGGSTEAMQRLNAAIEAAREALK
jgi:hypothetical protein